jgi:hypothetical protein
MKKAIFIIGFILLTFLTFPKPIKSSPTETTIEVTPASISVDVDQVFKVNITVDMQDNGLFQWVLSLSWDPAVLELLDQAEGPFLKEQVGSTLFFPGNIDNEKGVLEEITCGSLGETATGSGIILILTFKAKAVGTTTLHLFGPEGAQPPATPDKPVWLDINGGQHNFDIVHDGSTDVIPEFPPILMASALIFITLLTILLGKKLKMDKTLTPNPSKF